MGKSFWIIFILIFLVLGFYGFSFYQENLRGLGPALQGVPDDIAELIGNARKIRQNTTGLPLTLPKGFSISIFAKDLGDPRVLLRDASGAILVSIPKEGKVVALRDENNDGVADATVTVAYGLVRPHGMALRCVDEKKCTLFVAETNKISAYDYNGESGKATNKRKLSDLPDGGNHVTRSLLLLTSPEGDKLLVSIGSTCNVCNEKDSRRAKALIMNIDGSDIKTFASGLRNSVFMAKNPIDGKIFATEMGRDLLGDNLPPDEINILEEGKNYGWPSCYGKNIRDTEFDRNTYIRAPCTEPFETPSHIDIPAHSAPLGLAFVPEEGWPEEYRHNLFVAYHGSWNRTKPTGYKIVRYTLDSDGQLAGAANPEDFLTGWLIPSKSFTFPGNAAEAALGRPVDILALPGGVMFVSDDKAGVIYRIAYQGDRVMKSDEDEMGGDINSDFIKIDLPTANSVIQSPLEIKGEARGTWYFEASFPLYLLDENGKEIARGHAEAKGEWMTENFVPFAATLEFKNFPGNHGTLVLEKDNPSGIPVHSSSIKIPIKFR